MATASVTANHTTAQELFDTPKHEKGVLTALNIDNQSDADRTIRLQDIVTTDTSEKVDGALQDAIERLQVTVGTGLTANVPKDELEDAKFLGVAKAIADATEADCVIKAVYHFE